MQKPHNIYFRYCGAFLFIWPIFFIPPRDCRKTLCCPRKRYKLATCPTLPLLYKQHRIHRIAVLLDCKIEIASFLAVESAWLANGSHYLAGIQMLAKCNLHILKLSKCHGVAVSKLKLDVIAQLWVA